MTDGWALLQSVRANPDDDTPRLMFADWLDEQSPTAAFVGCDACNGSGRGMRHWKNDNPDEWEYPPCYKCNGGGRVGVDVAWPHPLWAEFIRREVAVAELPQPVAVGRQKKRMPPPDSRRRELIWEITRLMYTTAHNHAWTNFCLPPTAVVGTPQTACGHQNCHFHTVRGFAAAMTFDPYYWRDYGAAVSTGTDFTGMFFSQVRRVTLMHAAHHHTKYDWPGVEFTHR